MTELSIYWITRLDAIKSLFCGIEFFAILLGCIGVVGIMIMSIIRKTNEKFNRPKENYVDPDYAVADSAIKVIRAPFMVCVAMIVVCSVVNVFLPKTKEMIAIKVIPVVATPDNCEKVKNVSKDFLNVTAKWMEDLKKSK